MSGSTKAAKLTKWYLRLPKHKKYMDPESHMMPHPIYKLTEIEKIEPVHMPTNSFRNKWAYFSVRSIRFIFDMLTKFNEKRMNEK